MLSRRSCEPDDRIRGRDTRSEQAARRQAVLFWAPRRAGGLGDGLDHRLADVRDQDMPPPDKRQDTVGPGLVVGSKTGGRGHVCPTAACPSPWAHHRLRCGAVGLELAAAIRRIDLSSQISRAPTHTEAVIRPVVLMVIRLSAYRHNGTGHVHCADRR